ncbi:WD40 repeat-containing protein [Heterostelium album PN500]|uniref:Protein HIRA n=1 Tax=Heterostelium pallidum (strain ATCC 26659 / Pp 5 / PN500) TaxID=670386 RepID=D3BH38_HETP5|nr:WD40 repeat-containing protein [Heterostelium album PN500]EFA79422.1 WD40 repeat-containing protein [Heterostelium album PN500]|eukprot:XP_020431543.1 WD40 repeat-containing protein [Heterostelium album PN500]
MKILKPTWVEHSGYSIFSIDIHPDGTRFATGGGDNKVKIWSIAPVVVEEAELDSNVPRLLNSMESHYGPVNCVRWSRDGKYLASGSDDNLVMVWGLTLSGGRSSFISVGSSTSEKIVENWICVYTLRGHSADISEIAWSPDGKYLASSSFDKSIIIWDCLNSFSGQPMSVSEKAKLIKRAYGDAVRVGNDGQLIVGMMIGTSGGGGGVAGGSGVGGGGGGAELSMLAENPDQLTMEDETSTSSKNNTSTTTTSTTSASDIGVPIQIHPTQVVKQRQKETIINGRRRITPLNIGGPASSQAITKPSPLAIPSHLNHNLNGTPTISPQSSTTATTTDNDNNNNNSLEPMDITGNNNSSSNSESLSKSNTDSPTTPTAKTVHQPLSAMLKAAKQQQQQTPRDSSGSKSGSGSTQTTPTGSTSTGNSEVLAKRRNLEVQESTSKKKTKSSASSSSSSTSASKDKTTASSSASDSSSKHQSSANNQAGNAPMFFNDRLSSIQLQPATGSNHISKHLTTHDQTIPRSSSASTSDNFNLILDINIVEQELLESTEYFSTIRYLKDSILWENKINGKVCVATGNRHWCAVATHDATLHIFNYNGVSIMSNIVLRNQVSFLESNNQYHLLIITCDGYFSVWDIKKRKCEISNRELPFFLNRDKLTIRNALVTEEGKPIISMSNGVSYVFTDTVGEWIKITDRLGSLSEFNSNADTTSIGMLAKLQQAGKPSSVTDLMTLSNDRASQLQLSTTFLEKQLFLATILSSPSEYRHWLFTYVTHLTNHANQLRLQEICNDLLGPSCNNNSFSKNLFDNIDNNSNNNNSNKSNNNNDNQDLSKRELLRELLPTIAKNRTLQRMVGQYRESLNQFTSNKDNSLDILFS